MDKILDENELRSLSSETKSDLLDILYRIEDELQYKNKKITNTIDFLQCLINGR